MARIRSAKPTYWTDPLMCSLARDIRFTFKGLWEVSADDHGRFLADVRVLKGEIWPMDDDITTKKLDRFLAELEKRGRIVLYHIHGVRYGYLPNWLKHQKVSHPSPSRFPEPPNQILPIDSGVIPETLPSDSDVNREELIREELNRAERRGIPETVVADGTDPDPITRDSDRSAPPAPLVVMPAIGERFVEKFYSALLGATEKRRLDVRRQLYDSLDPRPAIRGARLRMGVYVKARSMEHFEATAQAVLDDPPSDPDKAIVWFLTKLNDPPKGPSVAEIKASTEKEDFAREERYHAARRSAGLAWAKAHPAEFAEIQAAVDQEFRGTGTSMAAKQARDSMLAQKCGEKAEFPTFDMWTEQRGAA